MTTMSWRAPTRLSVSTPEGWASVERLEVHHRDGDAWLAVESWPVGTESDLDRLAAAHASRRLGQPGGGAVLERAEVLGQQDGRRCLTSWADQRGRVVEGTLAYTLRDGRMLAVTEVAPTGDRSKVDAIDSILRSLRVLDPAAVDQERLPLRSAEAGALAVLGGPWLAGDLPDDSPEILLTTDEALAAARHFGVSLLPGADTASWAAMHPWQRDLTAAVAWRSLAARGATGSTPLREVLEVAASHDALLLLAGATGPTTWFAVRPDLSVRVRRGHQPGTLLLRTVHSAAVADLVLLGLGSSDAATTASFVHRAGGRVVGREATWNRAAGTDEVRTALVSLLPTDDEEA